MKHVKDIHSKRRSHVQRSPGDNYHITTISRPSSTSSVSLQSSLSLEAQSSDDSYISIGSNQQQQISCETPLSLPLYPFSLSELHDKEIPRELTYLPQRPTQFSPINSGSTNSSPSEASPQTSNSSVLNSLLRPEYQYEASRLETFRNWPVNAIVTKEELAQAGFVHKPIFWPTNCMDRVQCAFCKGVLKNWQPNQRPFYKHKKHFPRCPFVLNQTVP